MTTIVVPLPGPRVDRSGVAERALPYARALAERAGGRVVLVSVVELPIEMAVGGSGSGPPRADDATRGWRQERRAYLDSLRSRFPGLQVEVTVRYGEPADEVLAVANAVEEPIIVLASHAYTGIRRLLLGSVAFEIVQLARCPVMIVRADAPRPDPGITPRLHTLLIPLDGSPVGEGVLGAPLSRLKGHGPRVHLLRVVEPPRDLEDMAISADIEGRAQAARDYLLAIAQRLEPEGYEVSIHVQTGAIVEEILAAIDEVGADAILMATSGRRGLDRLLFGSVAEQVVRQSPVPCIVARPREIDDQPREQERETAREKPAARGDAPAPPRTRRVADIMSRPAITVRADATLEEVARLMLDHQVGSVVVVDDAGRIAGIITESDFTGKARFIPFSAYKVPRLFGEWISKEGIERIYEAGRRMTAAQIMSAPVVTAREDETITSAVTRMVERDLHRLPVVRDGRPVGVISRHDLLKMMVEEHHDRTDR